MSEKSNSTLDIDQLLKALENENNQSITNLNTQKIKNRVEKEVRTFKKGKKDALVSEK